MVKDDEWIEEVDGMRCPHCMVLWDYCDNETELFKYCPFCGAELLGPDPHSWDEINRKVEEHRQAYLRGDVWN